MGRAFKNPVAIDYLQEEFKEYFLRGHKKDLVGLLSNTNPEAFILLRELFENGKYNRGDISWETLSQNPSVEAYTFLQNGHNIDWGYFSKNTNPNAILLLEEEIDREMKWDMRQLDSHADLESDEKLNWEFLSSNPKVVHILEKKWKEEKRLMRDNIDKYNRLKEYAMILSWKYLSINPEPDAMKLIKEKIKQESELSTEDYNMLDECEKIDWRLLSSNPAAIKILSLPVNKDKLEYNYL